MSWKVMGFERCLRFRCGSCVEGGCYFLAFYFDVVVVNFRGFFFLGVSERVVRFLLWV